MHKKEIRNKLVGIIQSLFDISEEKLLIENEKEPLTGKLFALTSRELTYLLFEVEQQFSLLIHVDEILDYKFNSIHGIVELIEEKTEQNNS